MVTVSFQQKQNSRGKGGRQRRGWYTHPRKKHPSTREGGEHINVHTVHRNAWLKHAIKNIIATNDDHSRRTCLVVRRNRVNNYGDEDVDEDEGAHHDVAQEKRDGHRMVWSTANHMCCGALPPTRDIRFRPVQKTDKSQEFTVNTERYGQQMHVVRAKVSQSTKYQQAGRWGILHVIETIELRTCAATCAKLDEELSESGWDIEVSNGRSET